MRILHVQKSKRVGGVDRYVLDLAVHTPGAGSIAEVCCPKQSWLFANLVSSGTPTHTLPVFPIRAFRAAIAVKAIRKLIRERKIDVVHSHDRHGAEYALEAASLESVPNVRTMHGMDLDEHSLAADRLICVSQAVYDHYLSSCLGVSEKTSVVLFGVDTLHFRPPADDAKIKMREALGIPLGARTAGMVSRLTPAKGCGEFLDAIAQIPNVWGVFFGYAKPRYLRELQRRAAELAIQDRLVFAGPTYDVRSAFSALDITAMPSYREGFPLTMLESAACGAPVVASEVGGVPEFIKHGSNGLLVPPYDVPALSQAIGRLVDNEAQCSAFATAARETTVEGFDIRMAARRIHTEYERCVR